MNFCDDSVARPQKSSFSPFQLSASYPDGAGGPLSYTIIEGDSSTFRVDAYTGSLWITRPLDAENERSLTVVIGTKESAQLASDAQLFHTITVTVVVSDANDWIPAFEHSLYTFTIRVRFSFSMMENLKKKI